MAAPPVGRLHASSPRRLALLAADLTGLTLAYLLTNLATGGWLPVDRGPSIALGLLLLPAWAAGASAFGLYTRDDWCPEHSTVDDTASVVLLVTAGTWVTLVAAWLLGGGVEIGPALFFWVAAIVLLLACRGVARVAVARNLALRQTAVVVGSGDTSRLVARKLTQHPEYGIRLVGFVAAEPADDVEGLDRPPVLGPPAQIAAIVSRHAVDRVIVAFPDGDGDGETEAIVRSLRPLDVHVDVVARPHETLGPLGRMHSLEGMPMIALTPPRPAPVAKAVKRAADAGVAATLLLLFSPLFAWIAWRIKRDSPGPVLYRQVRLTQGERPFTMLKFRTMTVDTDDAPHREYVRQIMDASARPTDGNMFKLNRSANVTRVGGWLRRTSLDELPQLINVLRGDMSLVGPRPCIPYELDLYLPHHFDRFLVPGGMTGMWQVVARAHSTLKEALELDVAYARNWSLGLDLWLLLRTLPALLRGRGTI